MHWTAIIAIVAEYGLPVAEALFKKWTDGNPPTQADFDELRTLASRTAEDRMKAALVKQGIPLDSEQAIALLALLK